MPYTGCFRSKKVCYISEDLSRYSKYVRLGRTCDSTSVASFYIYLFFISRGFTNLYFIVTKTIRKGKRINFKIKKTKASLNKVLGRLTRLRY